MAPWIESIFLTPIFTTALPLTFSRQRLHWSCSSWSKRYLSQKRQQAFLYMAVVTDMTLQWYVLSKANAADVSYTPIWACAGFKKPDTLWYNPLVYVPHPIPNLPTTGNYIFHYNVLLLSSHLVHLFSSQFGHHN